MLKCIRCLKYLWTKNNPLCNKCAGRVEIPNVSNGVRKALEQLPKVTLDEIWTSINKRINAFEHYELIHHFNSERMFVEYLSLVEVKERTSKEGDPYSAIDLPLIEDDSRWQALNYSLTNESDEPDSKPEPMGRERRIEPYRESDDEWVETDEIIPAYLKHVTLED